MAALVIIVWLCYDLFNHSSALGHLGCFYILVFVNTGILSTSFYCAPLSCVLQIMLFFFYKLKVCGCPLLSDDSKHFFF